MYSLPSMSKKMWGSFAARDEGRRGRHAAVHRAWRGPPHFDADGNEYIDYVGSWGPLILGHRHPAVLEALNRALARGTSFGAPTEQEIELAEIIREMVPRSRWCGWSTRAPRPP